MSLTTNLQNFATRVSTEVKSLRTLINGNAADNAALTTTAKANLVAAINELDAAVGSLQSGGSATALDELTDVTITTPATGHLIRHDGTGWVNTLGSDHYQPADSDLSAIAALATTAYGRAFLSLVDQDALMALMRAASTTTTGMVELATTTETTTGTDTARAVTPAGLKAVADSKADTSSLAAVATSGNAADLTGTLSPTVLPPLAVNEVFVVETQAAMLALAAQRGDVAVRSDLNNQFILAADDPTILSNWVEIIATGDVVSVSGKTGAVTLTKADVGLSNVDDTSDLDKPISTAAQTALDGKQDTDATLTALAGVTVAANQIVYATGADAFATSGLTPFARTLLDDADAVAARVTLDVYSKAEIGNPETDFVATFNTGLV